MQHLQMISAVAQTGNLSRAAEDLAVTPSALSHRLAEAERRIGTALVLREGRRARLTSAGRMLLQAANEILDRVHQTQADIDRLYGGGFDRAFRLTVGHYGAYGWFAGLLSELRKAQENVHLYVRADVQRDPLTALRERTVDIALAPYAAPSEQDVLNSVRLFSDELVFLCARSDPLATSETVRAEDLSDREFLTYTRVVIPDQEYERFIRPADLTVRRWVDMEDPATIVDLIELGQGVSILSRWLVRAALAAGWVSALRLGQDGLPIEWHAIYREEMADDPQFCVVLNALSSHLAKHIDD